MGEMGKGETWRVCMARGRVTGYGQLRGALPAGRQGEGEKAAIGIAAAG